MLIDSCGKMSLKDSGLNIVNRFLGCGTLQSLLGERERDRERRMPVMFLKLT